MSLQAKVLTVSTSVHGGTRQDASGPSLAERLEAAGFEVVDRKVCADGVEPVAEAIKQMASGFDGLLVTTGGTGFAPTDLTPEATLSVIEREAPGLAEASRSVSHKGALSRGRAGNLGACLIVNLPGSPAGAVESIEGVIDLLPHALELLVGDSPH